MKYFFSPPFFPPDFPFRLCARYHNICPTLTESCTRGMLDEGQYLFHFLDWYHFSLEIANHSSFQNDIIKFQTGTTLTSRIVRDGGIKDEKKRWNRLLSL